MPTRRNPTQARSAATLARLEQAAKNVIFREGRDSFTTAHIAKEAGVSIGTTYRYFADRVAVLDHLYPNRVEGLNGPERKPQCDSHHPVFRSRCYRVLHHGGDHAAKGDLTWTTVATLDELEMPSD